MTQRAHPEYLAKPSGRRITMDDVARRHLLEGIYVCICGTVSNSRLTRADSQLGVASNVLS